MRIALFDAINERHVGASLERALRARGHDVMATGPVWRAVSFPDVDAQREVIRPALRRALDWEPDALLCLRPSALRPRAVAQIRAAGVYAIAWFADDPVLYRVLYRHVVEAYDLVLHCGPAPVLRFYEARHGPTGVNFPFWTDDEAFPFAGEPRDTEYDAVFLGSTLGAVRSRRYGLLAALPASVRLFGQVESDPAGIALPFLRDEREIAAALARARVGISLPQRFSDYRGDPFDFPGLAQLGSFEVPSRVVQYAATGLPVVSLDPSGYSDALPEMRVARDRDELAGELRFLLDDAGARADAARRTRARFERRFAAGRRAELLERLLGDPEGWRALPAAERATMWRLGDPSPSAPPAVPRRRPPVTSRPVVVVAGFYGAGNAGDELILSAIADALGETADVVVAAQRPADVVRLHGLPAFARSDVALTEAVVRSSNAVVLGGGGLLHDLAFTRSGGLAAMFAEPAASVPAWAPLLVMADILGRPVHLFGLGVGPLEEPDARRLVAWLAARAETVSVRDAGSRELLGQLAPTPVQLVPDPAYALDLGDTAPPPALGRMADGRSLLAVNVRPWEAPGVEERLAAAIAEVDARRPLAVVGLPMQAGPAADEGAVTRLLELLPEGIPRLALPWTAEPATLAAILRASAASVAMRLHASLVSHRVGTPAVGLAYDGKVAAHFEQVGRVPASLPLGAPVEVVAAAIEAALDDAGAWRGALAGLETGARESLADLARRMDEVGVAQGALPEAVLLPGD